MIAEPARRATREERRRGLPAPKVVVLPTSLRRTHAQLSHEGRDTGGGRHGRVAGRKQRGDRREHRRRQLRRRRPTACRSASRSPRATSRRRALNVTGLISSAGGGTSLRNMLMAAASPYGEVNPGVDRGRDPAGRRPQDRQRQRADGRRIRLGGEAGFADQDDQGLQGQEDRLHQSALDEPGARRSCCCRRPGYKAEDAELVKTGGFGEGIAALELGQIDVAPITEPLWSKVKDKYRALSSAQRSAAAARQRRRRDDRSRWPRRSGDFIRAVIRARRKAVEVHDRDIPTRPATSSPRSTTSTPKSRDSAVRNLTTSTTQGRAVLGRGPDPPRGPEADDRGAAQRSARSPARSTTARSSTRDSCPTTSRRSK